MFDKLVDLLVSSIRLFQFWTVIPAYASGVVLRFGKFNRLADPGLHWILPFYMEEVLSCNVVPETMVVGPQSLTTKDGVSVVISTVVTFSISDVKVFLLEIEGAGQVIEDSAYGIVSRQIVARTWTELTQIDLPAELTKAVRRQAKRYGVDVLSVQLADFTRSRSYRLMQQMHGHFQPVQHV